jgi:hypothetical protein
VVCVISVGVWLCEQALSDAALYAAGAIESK